MRTRNKYRAITSRLRMMGLTISTMESCTAGQVSSLLTDISGSSEVLKGAFTTYSDEAKIACGVPAEIIKRFGVYSMETAVAMAEACRGKYNADIGIGITGLLGDADSCDFAGISDMMLLKLSGKMSVPFHARNAGGMCDIVFYAVSNESVCRTNCIKLPAGRDRYHHKIAVADAVADTLIECIIDDFCGKTKRGNK